ncbi:hypothetical protein [Acidisphaera sp. L21]|uniref:hypothetical protein n=1 Tax=Acidisphaera sp. L21 TaxID=1641851 RepID=UPI00131B4780|nr:hypothetical protein [Acidisphaera sp. L21]
MSRSPKEAICPRAILAQAQHLIASAIGQRAITHATINETRALIEECQKTCEAIAQPFEPRVATSVTSLLRALPADGGWMDGAGKYSRLLHELLDTGTTLIEERVLEKPCADGGWEVRLSERGMLERQECEQGDFLIPY